MTVKRWNLAQVCNIGEKPNSEILRAEAPDGYFVEYVDYAALKKEFDLLNSLTEHMCQDGHRQIFYSGESVDCPLCEKKRSQP